MELLLYNSLGMVLKHVYFTQVRNWNRQKTKGKHEIAKAKRKGDSFKQVLSSLFKRYEVFSFGRASSRLAPPRKFGI